MGRKSISIIITLIVLLIFNVSCGKSEKKSDSNDKVSRSMQGSEVTFSGDERYDVVYDRKKKEIRIIHDRLARFNLYADDVGKFYDDYKLLEKTANFMIEYLASNPAKSGGDDDLFVIVDSYDIVGRSHFDTNKEIAEAYILLVKGYPESKYVPRAEAWLKERDIKY